MAFQSVPDTASIELRGTFNGVEVENTLYFLKTGGYDQTALNDLVAGIAVAWTDATWRSFLAATFTFREVYGRGLELAADVEATATYTGIFGTNGDNPVSSKLALCLAFGAGLTGRSTRGRNYVTGFAEGSVNGNLASSALADAIIDVYELMVASAVADGWQHVIVSRYTNGVKRANGVTYVVTSMTFNDLVLDTRRDRK